MGGTAQVVLVAQGNDGILGNEIHGGGHLGINQSHVAVGRGMVHAVFIFFHILLQGTDEIFVGRLPAALAGNQIFQVGAQTFDALWMQMGLGLAHGQNHDPVGILRPALGVGVKIAHGIQLVAEKLGTDGTVGGGGVDI